MTAMLPTIVAPDLLDEVDAVLAADRFDALKRVNAEIAPLVHVNRFLVAYDMVTDMEAAGVPYRGMNLTSHRRVCGRARLHALIARNTPLA